MENSYADIIEIQDIINVNTANDYLSVGWVLLGTYTNCYDCTTPSTNCQYFHYVLGWPSHKGEIKKPEPKAPKYGTAF